MNTAKHIKNNLEASFAAVTFAEKGDFAYAKLLMKRSSWKSVVSGVSQWLDNTFAAVTFAENGLFDEARKLAQGPKNIVEKSEQC